MRNYLIRHIPNHCRTNILSDLTSFEISIPDGANLQNDLALYQIGRAIYIQYMQVESGGLGSVKHIRNGIT